MLLHFHNPTFACNHSYNLHQKSVPLLQSTFTSLFHPYFLTKSSLQSPLTLPLYPKNFSPPYFCVQASQESTPKMFSLPQPFSQVRSPQGTKDLWSFVTNDTVFISLFFLKVWTVITGLTIADDSLLRPRKLSYCSLLSLIKMLAIAMTNRPIHLLSYPQPIVITSIPYLYHHKNQHSLICLNWFLS